MSKKKKLKKLVCDLRQDHQALLESHILLKVELGVPKKQDFEKKVEEE